MSRPDPWPQVPADQIFDRYSERFIPASVDRANTTLRHVVSITGHYDARPTSHGTRLLGGS